MTIEAETTTEQTTEETTASVVPETESVDATAAAAEETIEQKADQETSTDSEQTTEEQKTETETTTEATEKVADRVIPAVKDYKLPEGVPEHVAQFAHDNDLTQDQLTKTLEQFAAYKQAGDQGVIKAMAADGQRLVDSWGQQSKQNLSVAQRALKQNDPEGELTKVLDESGFGSHPAVLNFFLTVGNSMKEGGFLKGSMNTPKGTATAASTMFGKNHPSSN